MSKVKTRPTVNLDSSTISIKIKGLVQEIPRLVAYDPKTTSFNIVVNVSTDIPQEDWKYDITAKLEWLPVYNNPVYKIPKDQTFYFTSSQRREEQILEARSI